MIKFKNKETTASNDKTVFEGWCSGKIPILTAIARIEKNNDLDPGSISEDEFKKEALFLGYWRTR